MNLELNGKVALVCGASQGLGLAIGDALAEEGCRVGFLARNETRLAEHAGTLKKKGRHAIALAGDMGDWSSIAAALAKLRSTFGDPAILVNNTGGPPPTDVMQVDNDL